MRALGLRLMAATLPIVLFSAGCNILPPQPDRSRFFVLMPIEKPESPVTPRKLLLGIGPITFPRYLDRSEIVTRVGPNEVQPAAYDYWAGTLASQFEHALVESLQALIGADRVQVYPWYSGSPPDLTVEVDVDRFERDADGQAHLSASWRLRSRTGDVLRVGNTVLARPTAADPGSVAAALSALLGELSRQVAEAARSLP